MRRTLFFLFAATWLVALAGCTKGEAEATQRTGPKNLLLISIDSLRADHVGAYGYRARFTPERAVTPHLDALAAGGLRFDACWSSSSWTLPAHVSLFTGLDDPSHGVVDPNFRIDPTHSTLAEHLSASGFRCRGVYSGPFLDARFGFNRGFESWRSAQISETELVGEVEAWKQRRSENGRDEPSSEEILSMRRQAANWDVTGHRVNEQALRDLEELAASDRPWFLFLHYYDPHYDYLPAEADAQLAGYFDPEYQGPYDGVRWYFDPAVRDFTPPFTRRIPERDLQHIEALYDGEIHFVDRQIGTLLTRLERLGISEDTVVAVVSDHGDEFFDHGGIGHRSHLHTELTRAVFLLRAPGVVLPGQVETGPMSFVDIAPSLLKATGAPTWSQPFGQNRLPGGPPVSTGSFSHLFTDVPPHGVRHLEAWRDQRFTVIRPFGDPNPEAEFLALVQANWPDNTPAYSVYDRQLDPGELRRIHPSNPAYRIAVEAMRLDFLKRARQRASLAASPLSQRLADRAAAQELAMLEALGYQDGGSMARPLAPLPEPKLD